MAIGYVYHPIYLEHDTGQHPENRKRLEAIMAHLEAAALLPRLTAILPRAATVEELQLVHEGDLIRRVYKESEKGGWLDADTFVSPRSYEAARFAAGGVIEAVNAVMRRDVTGVFAMVRPPGHHATAGEAMGFCLFNNVAVAAKAAMQAHRLERVAIIDFDVHHGNGTNDIFWNDPRVLYVSTHQFPHYPGSGGWDETGGSAATGSKVNIPMSAGCGDEEYRRVFGEIIVPVVRRFRPQLIMVSAGYDAHWADGLAAMRVSVGGFAQMARTIKTLADELCEGRTVYALEGGYHLDALAASVRATFDVLLDNEVVDPIGPASEGGGRAEIGGLIEGLKRIHRL